MKRACLCLAVAATMATGCEVEPEPVSDAGREEEASPADAGGLDAVDAADRPEADADATTSVDGGPGPLTLVATDVSLLEDRICDLDGDGVGDNAIADLGSPESTLLAAGLTTAIRGRIDEWLRFVLHVPWVEDLSGPTDPEVVVIGFRAVNTEESEDLTDDFSGEEPFFVSSGQVDECGEPLAVFTAASLEDGRFLAESGTFIFSFVGEVTLERARLVGTIEPFGSSGEAEVCGYASIRELGGVPFVEEDRTGISALEAFLLGGAGMGVPLVPGVSPDVDVDGDGLERFEIDEEGNILSCIDGDTTVTPGADCWQDPRMADGFGLAVRVVGVSAVFAGLPPDWERDHPEPCEVPPETSLWDPM